MRFGGRGDSFVAPDIIQELFFMVSRQQLLSMRMGSKVLSQVWVWGASLDNGRANETTSFYIYISFECLLLSLCRHSVALWCSATPCMWSSGIFF